MRYEIRVTQGYSRTPSLGGRRITRTRSVLAKGFVRCQHVVDSIEEKVNNAEDAVEKACVC